MSLRSYARCLALLERCRPWLRMDMHLHGVADELLSLVRARALVDYVTPFEKGEWLSGSVSTFRPVVP